MNTITHIGWFSDDVGSLFYNLSIQLMTKTRIEIADRGAKISCQVKYYWPDSALFVLSKT